MIALFRKTAPYAPFIRLTLAAAVLALVLIGFWTAEVRAASLSKEGLFNKKHPECNYSESRDGWHVVSSVFSGFNDLTIPPTHLGAYVYLVYDPTVQPGFSLSDAMPHKLVNHYNYKEKTSQYLGRWPLALGWNSVSGRDARFNAPLFAIQVTMDKTTVTFMDPETPTNAANVFAPEIAQKVFGRVSREESSHDQIVRTLAFRVEQNAPRHFRAQALDLAYRTVAKVRGRKALFGTFFLEPRVYRYSFQTYQRSYPELRRTENWGGLRYSDEFVEFGQIINSAAAKRGSSLLVGAAVNDEWKYAAKFDNFDTGMTLFARALLKYADGFKNEKCSAN